MQVGHSALCVVGVIFRCVRSRRFVLRLRCSQTSVQRITHNQHRRQRSAAPVRHREGGRTRLSARRHHPSRWAAAPLQRSRRSRLLPLCCAAALYPCSRRCVHPRRAMRVRVRCWSAIEICRNLFLLGLHRNSKHRTLKRTRERGGSQRPCTHAHRTALGALARKREFSGAREAVVVCEETSSADHPQLAQHKIRQRCQRDGESTAPAGHARIYMYIYVYMHVSATPRTHTHTHAERTQSMIKSTVVAQVEPQHQWPKGGKKIITLKRKRGPQERSTATVQRSDPTRVRTKQPCIYIYI